MKQIVQEFTGLKDVLSYRVARRTMMSYSELIDQYEKMLRDIINLRSLTQSQIKACAVLRDLRVSQQVSSPETAEKLKKEPVMIKGKDLP